MSVRISTPRMTTEPSIRLWEERIFGLINSLTGLLTVLMAPRPSRELPPPQVPANWAVLRILAQSPFSDASAGCDDLRATRPGHLVTSALVFESKVGHFSRTPKAHDRAGDLRLQQLRERPPLCRGIGPQDDAVLYRHNIPRRLAGVDLPRTGDLLLGVGDHFLPLG